MGKKGLLVCFAIIIMFVTGCGNEMVVPPLEPPDTGKITAVEITTIDGFSCSCLDREWIERFVSFISSVQAMGKPSIQEHPASDYYGEFSVLDGDRIIETIYYYLKDDKWYVEKTYQA